MDNNIPQNNDAKLILEQKKLFNEYIVPFIHCRKDYSIENNAHGSYLSFAISTAPEKFIITNINNEIQMGKVAHEIWKELSSLYVGLRKTTYHIAKSKGFDYRKYKVSLYENAFLMGLCNWLGGSKKTIIPTIYDTIKQLMGWAIKTYEGNRVKFGVIIDTKNKAPKNAINFAEFINKDAAASISDGLYTYFIISSDGKIIDISDTLCAKSKLERLCPYELTKTCAATQNEMIGLCLSTYGDIYCFKREQLMVARINGKWVGFSFDAFKTAIGNSFDNKELADLYNTCLDVSYARTGGCIAICRDQNSAGERLKDILPNPDEIIKKFPMFSSIEGHSFFSLSRMIRKEYVAIDGATIINPNGDIISVGAIINSVSPSADGGGRKAATQKLSTFGIAIKISADGYIQIIKDKQIVQEFK